MKFNFARNFIMTLVVVAMGASMIECQRHHRHRHRYYEERGRPYYRG